MPVNQTANPNVLPETIILLARQNNIPLDINLTEQKYEGLSQAEALLLEVDTRLYDYDHSMKWKEAVPVFVSLSAFLVAIYSTYANGIDRVTDTIFTIVMILIFLTPVVIHFLPQKYNIKDLFVLKRLLEREVNRRN